MLQSSRREEAARTCVRGVAGKSRRRRKVQSSRKRHRQKRSWRRCGGVARTGVAVEASRGVAEASQRRYERALLHEQSEEQFTIVHLAYPWALRVSCQSDRSCSLVRRAIAEASRACCRAVAERRLRRHVSEASQGNCRGGVKARAVVRGIGKRDRGAVVSVQCGAVCSRLDSAPICCANAWFGPSLCHVFRGDPGTTLRMTRSKHDFIVVSGIYCERVS